ncbi:DUF6082 family protein [Streptomyces sp. NPDC002577]
MATQKLGARGLGCGLAFAAGALAFLAAHRWSDRRLQKEYAEHHRHAALAQQQRLQFDMLSRAMDDPDLAAVLDTFDTPLEPRILRQYLFANAVYTNVLLAWRVNNLSWEELHGHLRLICQNEIFRDYWEATRPHRASLVDSSDEARLGRMVDKLIRDLEEAETEEWWVVGQPPPETS